MNSNDVEAAVSTCPECGGELPGDAVHGLCPACLFRQARADDRLATDHPAARTTPPGFNAPSTAELAPLFPQLDIVSLLGQGGMGAVYRCRQTKLDRPVALKVLPADAQRDPGFEERFAREARALARLDHAGIVRVHDFGEADGLHYFIMEFVDGIDLRQLLQRGRLDPEQALSIVNQIAEALQYAHEEGIVHRDIKPENVLIDNRGRVRLADFGLAKLLSRAPAERSLTGTHQVMGTPHYMAPEQFEKPNQVDHRADIYALGVVFYEMLTGELPIGQFVPPSHKSRAAAHTDSVVLRALAREPERRFQSVAELRAALNSADMPRPAAAIGGHGPSVPFVCGGLGGDYRGRVHLEGDSLVLEFQHFLFYCYPLKVAEVRIPLREIERINVSGWWTQTITIQTYRLAALADMPTSRGGQVELCVQASDRELAQRFMRQLPADIFPAGAASTESSMLELEVRLPAAFIFVMGILNLLHAFGMFLVPFVDPMRDEELVFLLGGILAQVLIGLVMMLGARSMRRLQHFEFVIVAVCLGLLPVSFVFFVSVFISIWSLTVLLKPQVKLAFLGRSQERGDAAQAPFAAGRRPTGPVKRKARSILGNLYSFMFETREPPDDEPH